MIKLKPEYKIQRKIGKSNRWKMTLWADTPATIASCKINLAIAIEYYPYETFRIIKINKSYEVMK